MAGESILWGLPKYHKTKRKLTMLVFRTRLKAKEYKDLKRFSRAYSYGTIIRMKWGPDNV